jgi:uncharacterized membrane protein YccC
MLKRIDLSGILFAGGVVLGGIAYRYGWTETTLLAVGAIVVGGLTFAERRFAKKKT